MTNIVKPVSTVMSVLFAAIAALMLATPIQAEELPKVRFVTSEGAFELELRPDVAPKTVENFLSYVEDGFYDGTIFHRVIPGFMIQGGGFTEAMTRKQTKSPIVNEASATLPNLRGTVAMARTSSPNSATSQFFVNVAKNDFLNAGVRGAGYAVFGKVTEGMGVIDKIAGVQTGHRQGMADVPVQAVVIEKVTLVNTED
ncbi:MAG: peptidylprolyl isomerase [Marinobacter sp.]|uniref:peptidylprolyl isomerase n=1 Tax=Marinobacter sp. TaxID=50741 RepID=UPI0029C18F16|nr:peptidylprolyl isomerase [Marinobacter sp.]MDX5335814.1 peptidylprolyl isomerase [Marinobacter sp.]MDX5386823.1 peptidylprolyl isomerase [Marinobacter sp.]MDX5472224.1 peptidylprolyl isomerase [Marinobacter sp.]